VEIELIDNKAGAKLHGLDLSKPITATVFDQIYATYLEYANIVITRQEHIIPADYIHFCSRFGEIVRGVPSTSHHNKYSKSDVTRVDAPSYTLPDHPEIFVISNIEKNGKPTGLSKAGLYWHSDLYYTDKPSKVTFLLGKEIPAYGGDTLILNTYEVFSAMPEALKDRVQDMQIQHSWTKGWSSLFPNRAPLSSEERASTPDVAHPLVGKHPETGRFFLFPGAIYEFDTPGIRVVDLSDDESKRLYSDIRTFTLTKNFIYRHKWQVGDILATDNLAGMHCATQFDDQSERRTLYRVTIKGQQPQMA